MVAEVWRWRGRRCERLWCLRSLPLLWCCASSRREGRASRIGIVARVQHSPCRRHRHRSKCVRYGASAMCNTSFQTSFTAYLVLLATFFGLSLASVCCLVSFAGTGGAAFGSSFAACSSTKSCIFLFLSAVGMRLTRISSRDRRPCACRAYWARSLRARSVTADAR